MNDTVLRNCPFCGGAANVTKKDVLFRVECTQRFDVCPVNLRTHHCVSEQAAIKLWNTRVSENDTYEDN